MSRHRFDPFSFIAGAITVGVGIAVLLGQLTLGLLDLRVTGPVLVLLLGLALLVGGGRERARAGSDPDAADPDAADLDAADPDAADPDAADPEAEEEPARD